MPGVVVFIIALIVIVMALAGIVVSVQTTWRAYARALRSELQYTQHIAENAELRRDRALEALEAGKIKWEADREAWAGEKQRILRSACSTRCDR